MTWLVGLLFIMPRLGSAAGGTYISCHKEIAPIIVKNFLSGGHG